jgi:hypothetical protein
MHQFYLPSIFALLVFWEKKGKRESMRARGVGFTSSITYQKKHMDKKLLCSPMYLSDICLAFLKKKDLLRNFYMQMLGGWFVNHFSFSSLDLTAFK